VATFAAVLGGSAAALAPYPEPMTAREDPPLEDPNCADGTIELAAPPGTSGVASVGGTLSVDPLAYWIPCRDTAWWRAGWNWRDNWTGDILGTGQSYSVRPSDAGRTIFVQEIACTNESGCVYSANSAPVTISDPDSDGDGIPDRSDNCPSMTNSDQADEDVDGIGNVCDEHAPDDFYKEPHESIESFTAEPGYWQRQDAPTRTGARCRRYSAGVKVENRFSHRRYFSYYHRAEACYKDGRITEVLDQRAWGTSRWPWQFSGNLPGGVGHGQPGQPTVNFDAQGKFDACVFRWGCLNSWQPTIHILVRADGSAVCFSNVTNDCPVVGADLAPTAASIILASEQKLRRGIRISWRTGTEIETLGFRLYRGGNRVGPLVNAKYPGESRGASYSYTDRAGRWSDAYRLLVVGINGRNTWHAVRREAK
jgi:hypothetical protein